MDAIADAIVYAVACIHCLDDGEDLVEDEDDDSAIAHIMAYLSHATPQEEDALAAAAARGLKEEHSLHHRLSTSDRSSPSTEPRSRKALSRRSTSGPETPCPLGTTTCRLFGR